MQCAAHPDPPLFYVRVEFPNSFCNKVLWKRQKVTFSHHRLKYVAQMTCYPKNGQLWHLEQHVDFDFIRPKWHGSNSVANLVPMLRVGTQFPDAPRRRSANQRCTLHLRLGRGASPNCVPTRSMGTSRILNHA